MSFGSKPQWYSPAPLLYRLAHWLRCFFRRKVVSSESPELGIGSRLVVTLSCGHAFHLKPGKRLPRRHGCAACAHARLKGRKGSGESNRKWRSPGVSGS
jgi:hypothetical protein